MRIIRTVFAALLLSLLSGLAAPAFAGGAVLDLDQEFYVPGDVVVGDTSVWLQSRSAGRLEDGPFFAYLGKPRPSLDYPGVPADALRVARVRIEPRDDGSHGWATIRFTLPDVATGRYTLWTCNDPCELTLGDVLPTELIVAADVAEGRLTVRLDELKDRVLFLRHEMRNEVLGREPGSVRSRVRRLENEVVRLASEVSALTAEVRDRPAPEDDDGSASLTPLLALVPAAALVLVFARRRTGG